jgi:ElaB/YqjD/DUF883 family membrane-anchored ribosome-binding protein
MTTETTTPSAKTKRPESTSDPMRSVRDAVGSAAGSVQSLAADTADRVPEAVETARSVVERTDKTLRSGSDTTLAIGAALSFGVALGLLIGGSNRILVAAALAPAGVMVLDLYERSGRGSRGTGKLQGA